MKLIHLRPSRSTGPRAFTIIEIALCLGIIGFALVAIIAALPRGLDVQKRNREETIIAQDSQLWLSSLRGGGRGYDDLTNYVMCISNFWTTYRIDNSVANAGYDYYTPTNSSVTSISTVGSPYVLTNGARIVGLLSMPKWYPSPIYPPFQTNLYRSNYVVAYVRALSGAAVDKAPQTNDTIRGDAFAYRMVVENFPYTPVDTNAFCLDCAAALATNGMTSDQIAEWWTGRTNLTKTVWLMQTNVNDFRLLFRWPVLPNGAIGNYGYATFRAMADGPLYQTNDPDVPGQPLFFVQPSVFQGFANNPPKP
jgi:type II secretory pathway pseudopilin PulG